MMYITSEIPFSELFASVDKVLRLHMNVSIWRRNTFGSFNFKNLSDLCADKPLNVMKHMLVGVIFLG